MNFCVGEMVIIWFGKEEGGTSKALAFMPRALDLQISDPFPRASDMWRIGQLRSIFG